MTPKTKLILLFVIYFSSSLILSKDLDNSAQKKPLITRGDNGGISCATCTILLSITSQLAEIHNETISNALSRFCTYLPTSYQSECQMISEFLAPIIETEFTEDFSPDLICYSINLCYVEKKLCNLFPLPFPANDIRFHNKHDISLNETLFLKEKMVHSFPWICYLPGAYKVCQAIFDTYDKLLPSVDFDDDKHSPAETLRGSLWRGRDCKDFDGNTYPGRRPIDGDKFKDSNCNGIYGINSTSGLSFEEELCAGSGARGIIYIGDSVGAHFHVPPKWFTPTLLAPNILSNISYVVSNEFDWPDVGFATGYRNATYMPELLYDQNVESIYLKLRNRNLCNHRDYQNVARNGATSFDALKYMKSISRDPKKDQPVILIYSMVGNDVCNEQTDTLNHMTTTKEFYDNLMQTLTYMESTLPPNSHVILVGLIDGSVLYKAMHKRYHPLGELRKDLTYNDVYKWFNCMEIGPCHGWMSSNDTLRSLTTKHAIKLSRVLKDITREEKFTRFDIHYLPNPFQKVIFDWITSGGEVWELIEPVDSLHPTQKAQSMIANSIWEYIENNFPHVLGPINDNNDKIRSLFHDQGGH